MLIQQSTMIWNENIECMDRENLRKIQSIRLKKTVERVYHDTPFYRKKIIFSGILCSSVPSRDELTPLIYSLLCSLSSDA